MSRAAIGPATGEPVVVRAMPGTDSLVVGPDETAARIEWRGPEHAILAQAPGAGGSTDWVRTRLVLGPAQRPAGAGVVAREVLIDGWLVEVQLEPERRAALRSRARRAAAGAPGAGSASPGSRGATDIRAEIPGRIAGISVVPGDAVTSGQPLLVVEAMKMLNELRAPRDGVVEQVRVAVGQGVELGDLLVRLR